MYTLRAVSFAPFRKRVHGDAKTPQTCLLAARQQEDDITIISLLGDSIRYYEHCQLLNSPSLQNAQSDLR